MAQRAAGQAHAPILASHPQSRSLIATRCWSTSSDVSTLYTTQEQCNVERTEVHVGTLHTPQEQCAAKEGMPSAESCLLSCASQGAS